MVRIGIAALACVAGLAAAAQEGGGDDPPDNAEVLLTGRPAFALGDQPAKTYAACGDIRRMSEGLGNPTFRIDLSAVGELTSVRTDGALWYLQMCEDVKLLCVTYQSNGMKAGDRVYFRGGYTRANADHALLDPCLASRKS